MILALLKVTVGGFVKLKRLSTGTCPFHRVEQIDVGHTIKRTAVVHVNCSRCLPTTADQCVQHSGNVVNVTRAPSANEGVVPITQVSRAFS